MSLFLSMDLGSFTPQNTLHVALLNIFHATSSQAIYLFKSLFNMWQALIYINKKPQCETTDVSTDRQLKELCRYTQRHTSRALKRRKLGSTGRPAWTPGTSRKANACLAERHGLRVTVTCGTPSVQSRCIDDWNGGCQGLGSGQWRVHTSAGTKFQSTKNPKQCSTQAQFITIRNAGTALVRESHSLVQF